MEPLTNSYTNIMEKNLREISIENYRAFKDPDENSLLLHSLVCYNDENGHKLSKIIIDRKLDLDHQDKRGFTALHAAVSNENETVIKMLLDANAITDTINIYKYTPLMSAAEFQYPNIVKLLVDKGCNTTFKDKNGQIALELSMKRGVNDNALKCADLLFLKSNLKPVCKLPSGLTLVGLD
jgi:ankyrin repeat protein